MFLWQSLVRDRQEPQKTVTLPDAENEAEVRHFLAKVAVLLREQPWPQSEEFRKALEALVDFTETRTNFVAHYFPDSWAAVVSHAATVDGMQQSILYTTLNCISAVPSASLSPLLPPVWSCLSAADSMLAYTSLRILLSVSSSSRTSLQNFITSDQTRLQVLIELLRSDVDFLRNEAILFLKELCTKDEEMQKSLSFQGIFEALAEILEREEGVIVSDCLGLVRALTSDFTRNYIREVPAFVQALRSLLGRKSAAEDVVLLLETMLKDSRGDVIRNNQLSFSPLVGDLVLLAFPTQRTEPQSPRAIALLCDLLRDNQSQQRDLALLLLPAGSDFLSFFDVLLTDCVLYSSEALNWKLLAILAGNSDLQTQMISKITAVLGASYENCVGPFNSRLIEWLDSGRKTEEICSLLEILLAGNEVSKELAASLPISSRSQTLLQRLGDIVIAAISARAVDAQIAVLRLLSVWVYHHAASALTLYTKLIAVVPEMLEICTEGDQSSTAVAVLLAVVIDSLQDNAELGKIVLAKVGLPAFASKLELFFSLPEAGKHLRQGIAPPSLRFFTPAYVHVYRDVVPAAKKHLVRLMSRVTSGREHELAELIQLQQGMIDDLQRQMRMKLALGLARDGEEDSGEWKKRAETLERETLQLRIAALETENRAGKEVTAARQEAQGAVDAYIHSQERIAELEERVRNLHRDNELLRSTLQSSAHSSQLFQLTIEKEHAEREVTDLRREISALRATLRKIAGGRLNLRAEKHGDVQEEDGDLKVDLVFSETVENEEAEKPQLQEEKTEKDDEVSDLPLVSIGEPEEKREEVVLLPAQCAANPQTLTIEKPEVAPLAGAPVRGKLFQESPSFPDLSSFIEGLSPSVHSISEEATTPLAAETHTEQSEEEPIPPSVPREVPAVPSPIVGTQSLTEAISDRPPAADLRTTAETAVFPHTHDIDPAAFFEQVKPTKCVRAANPFAF